MPFSFSGGHTYFQFIIGYADVLLEADIEGIVLTRISSKSTMLSEVYTSTVGLPDFCV